MAISLRERLMNEEKNPVAINIYYNKNLAIDKRIKTILCGIEDAEIPFILIPDDEDDVKVVGDKAAKSSKLGVGIGISSNRVTLYQEKLSIEKPLFECSLNSSDYILRAIGTNGARLIKGNPFIII